MYLLHPLLMNPLFSLWQWWSHLPPPSASHSMTPYPTTVTAPLIARWQRAASIDVRSTTPNSPHPGGLTPPPFCGYGRLTHHSHVPNTFFSHQSLLWCPRGCCCCCLQSGMAKWTEGGARVCTGDRDTLTEHFLQPFLDMGCPREAQTGLKE